MDGQEVGGASAGRWVGRGGGRTGQGGGNYNSHVLPQVEAAVILLFPYVLLLP